MILRTSITNELSETLTIHKQTNGVLIFEIDIELSDMSFIVNDKEVISRVKIWFAHLCIYDAVVFNLL